MITPSLILCQSNNEKTHDAKEENVTESSASLGGASQNIHQESASGERYRKHDHGQYVILIIAIPLCGEAGHVKIFRRKHEN
jgi:hypothetical protein